ncbi:glycosyltransferase family 8 protein [Babjeviella inositovora NRRL Y-12698]|uniref:glycogenin glucosyltransferase n=1 Tax=Babjeviella inositovora NRRL Y-12698 TaxID=984486 RepID=A0A1E3QM05_9ASCO|nr:glycosyltransferase family 8 protein [Babjeviella inositovora NRRL Y-12698]ODQ78723.1 glycosyltransferase family 8 protein [Babjeviella inositovora NRRL Y-12698]
MSEAYVTILTSDNYLPGALVLARSLRELGTTKKLVVLTTDLSDASTRFLGEVYDELIEVETLESSLFEQLHELNRPELFRTYTKIALWKLTQFSKIVYLDADLLPVQNIDELFDIELSPETKIAAAPDSGWPDIFNSGLFVTLPDLSVYSGLIDLSEEPNASFDGADQGLFNEYFHSGENTPNRWHRLPFIYNVTPSSGYQYSPAYKRFQKDIKAVHFIGVNKPWLTRDGYGFASSFLPGGGGFDTLFEIHANWWKVFDRFYPGDKAAVIFNNTDFGKGEAWSLNVKKTSNSWDTDPELAGAHNFPSLATTPSPLFPWERRAGEDAPTRFFAEESTTNSLLLQLKQTHITDTSG